MMPLNEVNEVQLDLTWLIDGWGHDVSDVDCEDGWTQIEPLYDHVRSSNAVRKRVSLTSENRLRFPGLTTAGPHVQHLFSV